MLKRTTGRLLLTLLVITGLAGTVKNTSLSNKERKLAVNLLKESRTDLYFKIKNLSQSQLDLKSDINNLSLSDCLYHLVWNENLLWEKLKETMKQPATPDLRSELTIKDEDILAAVSDPRFLISDKASIAHSSQKWKTADEAFAKLKSLRTEQIKYLKTTTSDLRNRFIQTSHGRIDCYQFILYLAVNSEYQLLKMNDILAAQGFLK